MRLINISKLTYVLVGSFFFGLFVWLVGFFGWVLGRDGVGWKGMKVVDGSFGWEGMEVDGVLVMEYLLICWCVSARNCFAGDQNHNHSGLKNCDNVD